MAAPRKKRSKEAAADAAAAAAEGAGVVDDAILGAGGAPPKKKRRRRDPIEELRRKRKGGKRSLLLVVEPEKKPKKKKKRRDEAVKPSPPLVATDPLTHYMAGEMVPCPVGCGGFSEVVRVSTRPNGAASEASGDVMPRGYREATITSNVPATVRRRRSTCKSSNPASAISCGTSPRRLSPVLANPSRAWSA